MKDYKDWIAEMQNRWIGKKIRYADGENYTVVDVDYNGFLIINKKAQFTNTTAIKVSDAIVL